MSTALKSIRMPLRLLRLSLRDALLLGEAFASLAFFRLCLLVVPVRRIVAWLGAPLAASTSKFTRPGHDRLVQRVRWAVESAARHSPLEFVCFPQALAGLWMLRRRKISSTLIYGVAKSESNQLIAHTWLQVDEQIILGGAAAPRFTPINLSR